jgi:hypothetical protein
MHYGWSDGLSIILIDQTFIVWSLISRTLSWSIKWSIDSIGLSRSIEWSIDPIDWLGSIGLIDRLDDLSILLVYQYQSNDLSILLIDHDRSDDLLVLLIDHDRSDDLSILLIDHDRSDYLSRLIDRSIDLSRSIGWSINPIGLSRSIGWSIDHIGLSRSNWSIKIDRMIYRSNYLSIELSIDPIDRSRLIHRIDRSSDRSW